MKLVLWLYPRVSQYQKNVYTDMYGRRNRGGLGGCNPPWQNNGGVLIPKTPPAI